jgi:hypothetical protein
VYGIIEPRRPSLFEERVADNRYARPMTMSIAVVAHTSVIGDSSCGHKKWNDNKNRRG